MEAFIEQAEAAMRGESVPSVTLLQGQRPVLLDALGRRAVLSPFLAAFLWAASVFRAGHADALDPLSLLFVVLALALSVRALFLGVQFGRRVLCYMRYTAYQLALGDEGLLLRTKAADFALRKQDIVDIRERGAWQDNRARRWADVYLITRAEAGRTYLALPPVFERTPGILAERLMRWRGAVESTGAASPSQEPAELPIKVFDAVAAGERPSGITVLHHGTAWLARGPYATVLLGAAMLVSYLRLPVAMRDRVSFMAPLLALICLFVVPALWIAFTRYQMAPRKGIALLFTPAELLLRTRAGVLSVAWSEVARVEVGSRTAWSILFGPHESRSLSIHRKQGDPIHYAEAFLGIPAEVGAALCDGYRKGLLP